MIRHRDDPEPVVDSKATAVYGLGLLAALLGMSVGGIVPGTIALVLARQARADLREGAGWRTGADRIRSGERLAWLGILLAIAAGIVMVSLAVLDGAWQPQRDFPPGVD